MEPSSPEPESAQAKRKADLSRRPVREGDPDAARERFARSLVELGDGVATEDGGHASEQVNNPAERGAGPQQHVHNLGIVKGRERV